MLEAPFKMIESPTSCMNNSQVLYCPRRPLLSKLGLANSRIGDSFKRYWISKYLSLSSHLPTQSEVKETIVTSDLVDIDLCCQKISNCKCVSPMKLSEKLSVASRLRLKLEFSQCHGILWIKAPEYTDNDF